MPYTSLEKRCASHAYAQARNVAIVGAHIPQITGRALTARVYGTVEIRPKSPGVAKLLKYGRVVRSGKSRSGMWGR